ncbi:hypothetical protein GOODEAATRI_018346, partial [Goodea atripinnis]
VVFSPFFCTFFCCCTTSLRVFEDSECRFYDAGGGRTINGKKRSPVVPPTRSTTRPGGAKPPRRLQILSGLGTVWELKGTGGVEEGKTKMRRIENEREQVSPNDFYPVQM